MHFLKNLKPSIHCSILCCVFMASGDHKINRGSYFILRCSTKATLHYFNTLTIRFSQHIYFILSICFKMVKIKLCSIIRFSSNLYPFSRLPFRCSYGAILYTYLTCNSGHCSIQCLQGMPIRHDYLDIFIRPAHFIFFVKVRSLMPFVDQIVPIQNRRMYTCILYAKFIRCKTRPHYS